MGNVLFTGGPYTNAPDYEPQFIPVCVPLGSLVFIYTILMEMV